MISPIDGKVERRSVMNLKGEDQRTAPRVAVRVHAMVSGSVQSEGTGIILDLSRGAIIQMGRESFMAAFTKVGLALRLSTARLSR